ncbi:MAG: UvrD-helicase domain-containing protein, partial [bacterium]
MKTMDGMTGSTVAGGGLSEVTAQAPSGAPDQAQRSLIFTELDRNLLVEAAAGTGKTTCMLGRMIALIRTGRCEHPRNLAAVTFTRKAAAELRARFQVSLEQAVRGAEGIERRRLEQALAHLEQCFIGTIHSFCARLLRERPVEAGVDVGFEEIDEDADNRLRREAWSELAARVAADDPQGLGPELDRLGFDLSDLECGFRTYADFPDVHHWPVPRDGGRLPDLSSAIASLRAYVRHVAGFCDRLPGDCGNDSLIPELRRLPRVFSHCDDLARPARLMEMLELFNKKRRIVFKEWTREGAFTKEQARAEEGRWNKFREEVALPLLTRWYEHRYGPVIRIFELAREVYDRMRRERGLLNYQDLLVRAAHLLRENSHVRIYFRDRFRFLLVDEFQDTDPVQAEVMLLLTATDPAEKSWRKCRPRPGALFVVGDPKQSIYRFRRADIVTYNEVKEILRQGGAEGSEGLVVNLSANFRTSGPLIDWINRVFGPAQAAGTAPAAGAAADGAGPGPEEDGGASSMLRFPQDESDVSPGYVPLQCGRSDREKGGSGPLQGVWCLRVPEDSCRRDLATDYEAELIARIIRHVLDSGAGPGAAAAPGAGTLPRPGPGAARRPAAAGPKQVLAPHRA